MTDRSQRCKRARVRVRERARVSFWDFAAMGRPHWRGETSILKRAFFLLFGSPDVHTRLRNSYVLNQIEHLSLPPQTQVLEGGCGRAVSLFWLARRHPNWKLTGVELDPLLAKSAQRAAETGDWPNLRIVEGSIVELDERDAYDLIISIDMLEHIEDDVGLLRTYRDALRTGGHLVVHVPRRHHDMWRWLPAFQHHAVEQHVCDKFKAGKQEDVVIEGHVRDEYTARELRQIAEEAGLQVNDIRVTIGHWGEISFELNSLFWRKPALRYVFSVLTYPLAISLGYLDVCRDADWGNSLLLTATRE